MVILETWNNMLRGIYHSLFWMVYIFLLRDHIQKNKNLHIEVKPHLEKYCQRHSSLTKYLTGLQLKELSGGIITLIIIYYIHSREHAA